MKETMCYPYRLRPVYKTAIWGGTRLEEAYGKNAPEHPLAESWELTLREEEKNIIENGVYAGQTLDCCFSGNNFPLLVKFLDAAHPLSVQVHPEKCELWYIMEAKPGAKIVYGLKEPFDEARFCQAVKEGTLEDLLHYESVRAGEFYYIPSGLLHAIGDGIVIAEIQQNSGITYRVYDYHRGRELHIPQAVETLRTLGISRAGDGGAIPGVHRCEHFSVEKIQLSQGETWIGKMPPSSPWCHLLCVAGEGRMFRAGEGRWEMDEYDMTVCQGDSLLLPAGLLAFEMHAGETGLTFLLSTPYSKDPVSE